MNNLFPDLFDEGKTPEAPAAAQPTPEYDLTDLLNGFPTPRSGAGSA